MKRQGAPRCKGNFSGFFFFQRDETLKFSRTKTTQVKSQEYFRDSWLTMSKHWSFPQQTRCDVSDPTGLFEVRGEMCSEQECRIRELIYRAFHICASYCRSPPSLSCGFMRLVHVWVCVGLTSPSWLDSRISFFPSSCLFSLSLPLSLSQARIVPSALAWRHAHPDRALRQPVTTLSASGSSSSQRRLTVLRTVTFPRAPLLDSPHPPATLPSAPTSAKDNSSSRELSQTPETFWLMWFGIMNWEKMLKRGTLPASGRLSLPPTVFTPPLTHRGSFAPILCWRSSGETFGQRSNLKSRSLRRSFINETTVQVWLFSRRKLRHVYVTDGLVRNTVSLF